MQSERRAPYGSLDTRSDEERAAGLYDQEQVSPRPPAPGGPTEEASVPDPGGPPGVLISQQELDELIQRVRTNISVLEVSSRNLKSIHLTLSDMRHGIKEVPFPPVALEGKEKFLSSSQQDMLLAIDAFARGVSHRHLAAYLGIQPGSGHFGELLRALRDQGYVDGGNPVRLLRRSTPWPSRVPRTLAEIHEMWIHKLGKDHARMGELVKLLLAKEDHRLSPEEIQAEFGIQPKSSYFRDILHHLKEKGIIQDAYVHGKKFVELTDFLLIPAGWGQS